MPIRRVPGIGEIYFSNPHTGDRIIDLKEYVDLDDSMKNEDIVIVGNWSDYSGSGTKGGQEVMMQGLTNELAGDLQARAGGADFDEVTNRGSTADTHRQRNKLIYVEN